ncbi:MAG: hypothetical protein EU531_06195 [Promethearchaeota archaeon]|nr:MAG: hypothetical protein EU531_06195 [Candidatus Lokiarchaeota archaeon]
MKVKKKWSNSFMSDIQVEVTYFRQGGPKNTDTSLKIAKKYADEFSIKDIIIASTTGMTAQKSLDHISPNEFNIIIMTHSYYFTGIDKRQEFPEELMNELREKGLKIFSMTHALGAVSRSFRLALNQWMPVEVMAKYLRQNFCQGVKVCMEIAAMAADAGLILDINRDAICVAGTGRGADTVCLIKPMPTGTFDKLRVKAILAKPL